MQTETIEMNQEPTPSENVTRIKEIVREAAPKMQPEQPVKRPRGRPRKVSEPQAQSFQSGDSVANSSGLDGTVEPSGPPPEPVDTTPMVEMVISVPFKVAAEHYKFPKFELDETQRKTLAESGEQVRRTYWPNFGHTKETALTTFAMALIAVVGEKVWLYKASVVETAATEAKSSYPPENQDNPATNIAGFTL